MWALQQNLGEVQAPRPTELQKNVRVNVSRQTLDCQIRFSLRLPFGVQIFLLVLAKILHAPAGRRLEACVFVRLLSEALVCTD